MPIAELKVKGDSGIDRINIEVKDGGESARNDQ